MSRVTGHCPRTHPPCFLHILIATAPSPATAWCAVAEVCLAWAFGSRRSCPLLGTLAGSRISSMSSFRILIVVSLAASLLMVGVGMIVALLPQRVLDLSGSLQDVGYVASFFALSYLMLQLPLGNLADRFYP